MDDPSASDYLTPEARARVEIDSMLTAAGWAVQHYKQINLGAAQGVAVREFPLEKGHGFADYLLFVDRKPLGVVEAKKAGTTLTGVEWQSDKYTHGLPQGLGAPTRPLPFAYESTGKETRFTNGFDPEPRSRRVFWFHRPETFAGWVDDWRRNFDYPTLRAHLRAMPPLVTHGLWPPQVRAIENLEASLAHDRPRALIQMATGSGKTYTAANIAYRLIKHAGAKRVLFLVDRANLGRQTLREFQAFSTPDDGRKLTELYNVQHLQSSAVDRVANVVISTIQRLYCVLRGETEVPEDIDELSGFDVEPSAPVEVEYNPDLPVESFDVIIVDECHRSIYGVWRQVLEYFDVHLIGLTATPGKQTFGFFDQNLVMEYGHEQAVVDRVNVDFDVFRIKTEISERGSTIDAGLVTQFRDRETRAVRLERVDEDIVYDAKALDRQVVARDQIRTIVRTFRDRLPEIFPGRDHVPKTLVFAKDDSHADDIVQIVREEFGKGNDFAVKITYRSGSQGQRPEQLLQDFRTRFNPRIAVTVDMIATGTDVKPLECVFFMRMVKSRNFFEQMKGRGVRVIDPTDLQAVTPDDTVKDRFVIVDAVGVTETELTDTVPLERKPTVSLERLLHQLAIGMTDDDLVSTVASRLARLDQRLTKEDRAELEALAGMPLAKITRGLVGALDPDLRLETSAEELIEAAARPLADNPELRQRLVDVRRSYEQTIDETSRDRVVDATFSLDGADRARATVTSFREFIEEHRDEITALQVLYSRPYAQRLTFAQVKELAHAIERPPYGWTTETLWSAYETLDRSKVHGSPGTVLTNIVSLVRFALEQDDSLVPYPERVEERFEAWLAEQEALGRGFTDDQREWLRLMADTIGSSLEMTTDAFDFTPFLERGGLGKAYELFGDDLQPLLDELTVALAA